VGDAPDRSECVPSTTAEPGRGIPAGGVRQRAEWERCNRPAAAPCADGRGRRWSARYESGPALSNLLLLFGRNGLTEHGTATDPPGRTGDSMRCACCAISRMCQRSDQIVLATYPWRFLAYGDENTARWQAGSCVPARTRA
jgi:hypothetical protein